MNGEVVRRQRQVGWQLVARHRARSAARRAARCSGAGSGCVGVWAAAGSLQTKEEGLMVSWISLLVVSAGTRLPGNANQPSLNGMESRLTPGTHTHMHSGYRRVSDTQTYASRSSLGSTMVDMGFGLGFV